MPKFSVASMAALMIVAAGSRRAFATAACSTSDIEVCGTHWRVAGRRLYTLGEPLNHCAEPVGVQLKVTTRDAEGKIIDTDDEWPASTRNIPPDRPYPFKTRNTSDVSGVTSVSVDVIEVRQWGE